MQNQMALAEGAAFSVLSAQAYGNAVRDNAGKGIAFCECPVDLDFVGIQNLRPAFPLACQLWRKLKAIRQCVDVMMESANLILSDRRFDLAALRRRMFLFLKLDRAVCY